VVALVEQFEQSFVVAVFLAVFPMIVIQVQPCHR
jgi:hypothetical protein